MKKIQGGLLLMLCVMCVMAQAAEPDSAQIQRGEYLSRAGDCAACHTAPGGKPFAGGLKMMTPVGAIWSTNITPDVATGMGGYSERDFSRALRQGIARDGHRLYPAMPYPSFSKMTDRDIADLYVYFLHQVLPVSQKNRHSEIPFPLDLRFPLVAWDHLFTESQTYYSDPKKTADWNRGAYLVQGLGHCGSCHTPRGVGYQEKALDQTSKDYLSGGMLDGWHAPNLRGDATTGLGQWNLEEISQFLKTGHTGRATAFGSMAEVIHNSTQYLSDADRRAIAVYLKSLPADGNYRAQVNDNATTKALDAGIATAPGAQIYVDNCLDCHLSSGQGEPNRYPTLAQNPVVVSDDPTSLINLVLNGSKAPKTQFATKEAKMPGFGAELDDQQIANVVTFIRHGWGNQASTVSATQVKEMRALTGKEDHPGQ